MYLSIKQNSWSALPAPSVNAHKPTLSQDPRLSKSQPITLVPLEEVLIVFPNVSYLVHHPSASTPPRPHYDLRHITFHPDHCNGLLQTCHFPNTLNIPSTMVFVVWTCIISPPFKTFSGYPFLLGFGPSS